MKLKYLVGCILPGIMVLTISASSVAKETNSSSEIQECTTNTECSRLKICFQNRCMTKTQRHTIKTNANNLIIPGAVLAGNGAFLMMFGGVTVKLLDEEVGAIFILSGGAAFITGVVLLSVGLAKRTKMEREKLAIDIRTKHGRLTLEPTFAASENGGVFGLSGRF